MERRVIMMMLLYVEYVVLLLECAALASAAGRQEELYTQQGVYVISMVSAISVRHIACSDTLSLQYPYT